MPRRPGPVPVPGSPFGERLIEAMAEAGLSMSKLEQLAGLGRGYLSRVISGQRGRGMEAETVFELAHLLGVRGEWLYLGQGPRRDAIEAVIVEGGGVAPGAAIVTRGRPPASTREAGAAVARMVGIAEHHIVAVLARFASDPSLDARTALWWLDQFRAEAAEEALHGESPARKTGRRAARMRQ